MKTWIKHEIAKTFCVLDRREGGSVISRCRGRFPATDNHVQFGGFDPPLELQCGGCTKEIG